jgi:hypothetical protein
MSRTSPETETLPADEEALANFIYSIRSYDEAEAKAKLLWPLLGLTPHSPFKDGDPLVTALIWEVDRAVKMAMREGGKYETTIRHILNEHLRGHAPTPREKVLEAALQRIAAPHECPGAVKIARAALSDTSPAPTPADPDLAKLLRASHQNNMALWEALNGGASPQCRDCADFNGRCQGKGEFCDPQERALDQIKRLRAAASPDTSTDRPFDPAEWEQIIEDRQASVSAPFPEGNSK